MRSVDVFCLIGLEATVCKSVPSEEEKRYQETPRPSGGLLGPPGRAKSVPIQGLEPWYPA